MSNNTPVKNGDDDPLSVVPPTNTNPTESNAKDDHDEESPKKTGDDKPTKNDDPDTTTFTTAPTPPLSKILALASPEHLPLLLALLLMIATEGTSLYIPILLAKAYDVLVDPLAATSTKMDEINSTMIAVIALSVGGMFTGFLRSAMMGVVGERVVARLRNRLYQAILTQEIAFFDDHKTGELVSRLGSDTTLVQLATSYAVPEVIVGFVKVCVCVGLMFWISPELAGVSLGIVVAISLVCLPLGKKIGSLARGYQDALGRAQNSSTEALGGIRTVQAFVTEGKEGRRYGNAVGNPDHHSFWAWCLDKQTRETTTYGVGVRKAIWTSGFFTILFGAGFGSINVALWLGFKLVVDGKMSLGELTAFQSYIFQIGAGLGTTSRFLTQLLEAMGASARIFQLLERTPAISSPSSDPVDAKDNDKHPKKNDGTTIITNSPPIHPSSMTGTIVFSDVSFAYPSRPDVDVLTKFDLTIPANSTVALVGPSGAGKSTVVSLLQRFYDVRSGSITFDGNNVKNLDLDWLRRQIGYVEQEPQLFGLTVRENVAYGILDEDGTGDSVVVTQERIEAACKMANAHDFIVNSLGDGYDTLVGERGVKLSGGQKQRIAIARAVLINPRILLLDEATSALDSESEHLVQNALDNAAVGRTVLIIAHRLSTVREADQIVVVDDHRIIDVGKHDELNANCDVYRELIKRQAMANK